MATNLLERRTKAEPTRKMINLRVPVEALAIIDHAAALQHTDRTAFIVGAAAERANETILDQTSFVLNDEAFDTFVATLDTPRPVNPKLRQIMQRKPSWDR